jgi:DNA-binding CsgD family transcriptional regulator
MATNFRDESNGGGNGASRALSARERQVHEMLGKGRTSKEVAFELGIAAATVRVLQSRARKKLGIPAPPQTNAASRPTPPQSTPDV